MGFEKFVAKKTGRFVDAKPTKETHSQDLKGKDTTEAQSPRQNTQTKHLPAKT